MTSLVQVDGLSVSYVGSAGLAVRNVSLDVPEGDIHGLVGESGSGKSTIARALLGLTDRGSRIRAGTVTVAGSDLSRASPRQLRRTRGSEIAYVGQNPFGALHPLLRIERQFELMRRAHPGSLSRAQGRARCAELLVQVGIDDPERVLRGYVHELSGGMAQRTVIAMAMFLEPRLIVADEPTTGLDVTLQRQILDLLVDQARDRGVGLLLITHDLGVVAQYCETVTVLYAGQLMEAGPVKAVLTAPRHPYTQALVSAVPVRGQPLATSTASGHHPVLDDGCPFRLRCPIAREVCSTPLRSFEITPGWRVSCHAATETV